MFLKRLIKWLPILAFAALLALQSAREHSAEQRGYERGLAQAQAEYAAASAHAQAMNEMSYRAQIEQLNGAQDEQTKNIRHARADADRARTELDLLRAQIATLSGDSHAGTATPGDGRAAKRDLLESMGATLEGLASAGATLAEHADTHAADSLMLQRAWPK